MNNKLKILCLGGLGLFLSGCLASERDMGTLKLQLKELNETIALMQTNQAELASKMEELNQNLAVSNENLSQLVGQLFNLSSKLDDINAVVTGGQGAAGAGAVMLPSDVFNEAKNHLTKQSYDLAVTGFKLYIEKYPDGENIQQAYIYLGDAYAALMIRTKVWKDEAGVLSRLAPRMDDPTPRVAVGRGLRSFAHAAVDVSDGLLQDLGHILERSGVGAVVDWDACPKSEALCAFSEEECRRAVLGGGDDYELLFCAAPEDRACVEALARETKVPLTRIGRIVERGLRVADRGGADIPVGSFGFDHFAS